MEMQDITRRLEAIRKTLGVGADAVIVLMGKVYSSSITCDVYPFGLLSSEDKASFAGGTFEEILSNAESFAQGYVPRKREKYIRKIALDIIDLALAGVCARGSLETRHPGLADDDVRLASEVASQMAGFAPFRVV